MKKYAGEEFLNKIYKDLVNSDIVKHTARGGNKNEDVHIYMDRLERITSDALEHNKISLLKKMYYDKYVIKEENIPESYFEHQEQIALDRGYGHVHYDERTKKEEANSIISEQKASLDSWLEYFSSSDTNMYPTWFKYFCFQGMLKIGYFDKSKHEFTKRTSSTVKPFVELNREAIALIYDELLKLFNKEELTDLEMKKLLDGGGFSKIYAYAIKKINSYKKTKIESDEGIWKKYLQGSNPEILFNDIHGKGTGWCTAGGIGTATAHINGGDFYVYFTKDENGEFVQPRIAIRTESGKIAEIRGIAENQNLESNMEKVVETKLEEFPDREEYKKKVSDMEKLTNIYIKWKNKGELNIEDLRFLYEIDDNIIGFGYEKDPRINEIINTRNNRKDLAYVFNCDENQISLTKEEALRGNIVFHNGDLILKNICTAYELELPKIIKGSLVLSNLTSTEDLKLPEIIKGDLILRLENARNVKIPQNIGNDLNLIDLKTADGLVLPKVINGNLCLHDLESAEGLKLPDIVGRNLFLDGLKSAKDLVIPQSVGMTLYLNGLKRATHLILPKKYVGSIDLSGLVSAEDLELPIDIDGNLSLDGLMSAKYLVLPKNISDSLSLWNLIEIEDLAIPDELDCKLYCPLANYDINTLKQMCKNNYKRN